MSERNSTRPHGRTEGNRSERGTNSGIRSGEARKRSAGGPSGRPTGTTQPSKKKKMSKVTLGHQLMQLCLLPIAFAYFEVVMHIAIYHGLGKNLLYPILFSMSFGFVISFGIGFTRRTVAAVLNWIALGLTMVLFLVQIVYYGLFKTYLTFFMMQNAADATEFWRDGLAQFFKAVPVLLIFALPLIFYAWIRHVGYREHRVRTSLLIVAISISVVLFSGAMIGVNASKKAENNLYGLLYEEWRTDDGVKHLGIYVNLVQDVKKCLTYDGNSVGDISNGSLDDLIVEDKKENLTPEPTREPSSSPTPTPTPIDKSPNMLNIDFASLAEKESKDSIKAIHEYMASAETTNKNEYTGMFEGYNLIMLTCEAFSTWCIDENLTPTLYKMAHEGFVFNNFYNPVWITSTSDGEYVECMGLYPDLQKNNSFRRAGENGNYLPYCFGNMLKPYGYTTRAYHNNTYDYYGRDKSHPLMGYEYKAVGHGLDIKKTWPESDLEMMQVSMDDYINDDLFHAYYMTVSGHMRYNWTGNTMCAKHREEVQGLPYSDPCKAYIACNMELDQALAYMIERLEAAGKLDKTLFVFAGDHYPYGLELDEIKELSPWEIDETFELYRSTCVIWSASMKEPIPVDKYCSTVDIMPTVCNLLGLNYDSRLYIGHDIFADNAPLVIFKDGSWITEYCKYNAKTGNTTMLKDVTLPENYTKSVRDIVKTKFTISRGIVNNNYYKYLKGVLP